MKKGVWRNIIGQITKQLMTEACELQRKTPQNNIFTELIEWFTIQSRLHEQLYRDHTTRDKTPHQQKESESRVNMCQSIQGWAREDVVKVRSWLWLTKAASEKDSLIPIYAEMYEFVSKLGEELHHSARPISKTPTARVKKCCVLAWTLNINWICILPRGIKLSKTNNWKQ